MSATLGADLFLTPSYDDRAQLTPPGGQRVVVEVFHGLLRAAGHDLDSAHGIVEGFKLEAFLNSDGTVDADRLIRIVSLCSARPR